MKRRDFIKTGALAAAVPLMQGQAKGKTMKQPNILMITCHDLGQHLGCYGVESVDSPNLDRLAEKGIRFQRFYSTSAVCSPGRGSLHTGRYPQSNGLMGLTHAPWWWRLNPGERHTAALLRDEGYHTRLIGFQHVTDDPRKLGYEEVTDTRKNAEKAVEAAGAFLNDAGSGDRPFFLKVGFTEVHRKFTHGDYREKGVFVPGWLQETEQVIDDLAAYQAEIRYFDGCVGRILDTLEKSDVARDTLVIFTADHGIPYVGAKWSARKAGLEVPFILYQPDTVFSGGKVFPQLMSNVDVLPTILDFLGAPVPENIQGVSFWKLIEGKTDKAPRSEVFGQYTPDMKRDNLSRCVITEDYQLIRYFDQGRAVDYPVDVHPQEFANHHLRCKTRGARPFAQLYDLKKDPYELNDIGSEEAMAPVVADLSRRLFAWMKEVDDPLLEGPLRTPYYDQAISDLKKTVKENPS